MELFASVCESARRRAVQALSESAAQVAGAHGEQPAHGGEPRLRGGCEQRRRRRAARRPRAACPRRRRARARSRSSPRAGTLATTLPALVAERRGVPEREIDHAAPEERAQGGGIASRGAAADGPARPPRARRPARRDRARRDRRRRGSAPRSRARAASRAARRALPRASENSARRLLGRLGAVDRAAGEQQLRAPQVRHGAQAAAGVAHDVPQACPGRRRARARCDSLISARRPEATSAPASSPRSSTRSMPAPGTAPGASGGTIRTRQPVLAATARSTSAGNAEGPAARRTGGPAGRSASAGWAAAARAATATSAAIRPRRADSLAVCPPAMGGL